MAKREFNDRIVRDGLPDGWFIQDRLDERVTLLIREAPGMWPGSTCICLKPRAITTDEWLPIARQIALGFDTQNHAHETHVAPQCCMCGKKNLSTVEGDGGSECELEDGRWVCSAECWDRAVEPSPEKHVAPDAAARLERILRLGKSMKWTPDGAPALDDENTAVALGELFQIYFQDAVDRALATTEGSTDGR